MKLSLSLLLIASVPLSACAMQEGDFPSLAKRPYEDIPANADPSAPPPAPVSSLPAPLQKAVDQAVQQSEAAHSKFLRNLPVVKRRVNAARGASVSSEAWVVAQMDLSSLEFDRSASVEALADIDRIYIERLNSEFEENDPGGAALIARKRDLVQAQVNRQQEEIDGMKSRLR